MRSAQAQFLEIGRAPARRKRWLWLTWLSPLRAPFLFVVGTWSNLLAWAALGAAHCDRPRLQQHALARDYKGAAGLHGVSPYSLELIPLAGGKPNVVLWCVLLCLAHAASCAWRAAPVACSGGARSGDHGYDCAALAGWSANPRSWDSASQCACVALLAVTLVAGVVHDPAVAGTAPCRRFKVSLTHFTLRWLGPVPALLALLLGRGPGGRGPEEGVVGGGEGGSSWLLFVLVALQGLVLAAHWVVKGVVKRLAPGVDPSGHARVCLNTLVYVALIQGEAEKLGVTPARSAVAFAYLVAQLATVLMSGWAHHPTLDLALGYLCVLPQLALLRCFLACHE